MRPPRPEDVVDTGRALRARVVPLEAALTRHADEWEALAAGYPPTARPAWVRASAAAWGGRVGALAVFDGPRLAAIAPVVGQGRAARLEPLGCKETFEPTDFVYADAAAARALAEALAETGAALWLRRVPEESLLVEPLRRALASYGTVRLVPTYPSGYLALGPQWREPERAIPSGLRQDLRRRRRIAERQGPVSFEVHAPREDELGPLLEQAWRVEGSGWKGQRGSSVAGDPAKGVFFRSYTRDTARAGILRLGFLRIGGEAAAMILGVVCAGSFWELKIGYDERFARATPGHLLRLEMARALAEAGVATFEFFGVMEPWARRWTSLERRYVSLRNYPHSLRGAALLAQDATRPLGRWLKRASPG